MTYKHSGKWDYVHEWFSDKVDEYCAAEDIQGLRGLLFSVYDKVPVDDMEAIYQRELEADGFFEEAE